MLALLMLLSFTAFAKEKSAYITVSDLYYADPEKTIDLTGLSVNLKLSGKSNFAQLLLSLFTGTDDVTAAIETDNQVAYLYAEGFSVPYAITFENLSAMLSNFFGQQPDLSVLKPGVIFAEDAGAPSSDEPIGINNLIHELYSVILGDASQIQNAKTATVSTFTHDSMSAFVVPLEIDQEQTDQILLNLAKALDSKGIYGASMSLFPVSAQATEGEAYTFEKFYTEKLRTCNFSVIGNTYYGEDNIFLNLVLCADGIEIVPVFLEITNNEDPVLYLNVPIDMDEREIILYATVEATADRSGEYVELGLLNNGDTDALIMYQKGMSEDGTVPAYDFYAGAAYGMEVFEITAYYESDEKTARKLDLTANLSGIMLEILYDGNISLAGEETSEVGRIRLSSNIGIKAEARLGFGTGAFDAASLITEPGSIVVLSDMNEQQTAEFAENVAQLRETVTAALASGIPGFAALMDGTVPAEG